MLRDLLEETIFDLENDMDFRRLKRIEAKVQHILLLYINRNELRDLFKTRADIIRKAQKSYQRSKKAIDSTYNDFQKITEEMDKQYLEPEDRQFGFMPLLDEIEKAILYAPHNQMDILFKAYILKLKIHLQCDTTDEFIHDYIQWISICDDLDSTEKFDVEIKNIEESITADVREMIEKIKTKEYLKQTEYMPTHKVDERCVFVSHPERGRFMIAKELIQEEDVLIAERPQILGLNRNHMNEYCSYCFVELQNSFYPCSGCIDCRFCNKKCAQKAMSGFHRYECTIVGYITDKFKDNWLLAYRVLSSLGINNIKELHQTFLTDRQGFDLEEWILKYSTEIDEFVKNPDEMLYQYKGLSSFVDHSSDYNIRVIVSEIFDAMEIVLLIEETEVFKDLTNEQNFIRLVSMIIKHYNRCLPNAFGWRAKAQTIGQYLSLISTMVNHSCVPNADWSFRDGKHMTTAFRDIKAGEEISVSYGVYALPGYNHKFIDRQLKLRTNYNFICDCEGCRREKSKVISFMKCRECSGTVYYGPNNPNRICICCGVEDDKHFYDNRYNNVIRKLIFCFNYLVDRDFHTERTIFYVEQVVDLMSERCVCSSPDLLRMRQTLNALYIQPFGQDSDTEMSEFFQ